MNYNICKNCKETLRHVKLDYFFYCSEKCKSQHEKVSLEKRIKTNKMHNPPARRGETDVTNEIIKQAAYAKETPEVTLNGKPKGKRKCGKCGEYGHNARTCK